MYRKNPDLAQSKPGAYPETYKRARSSQRGFTLIEVLLAMSITVLVSVIAYQALDSVIGIVESQEQQEKKMKDMGLFFSVFNKDFRQIVPRKIRHPSGQGHKHALFYHADASPMLEFTRGGWGNPAPENFQRSHLQRVAYYIEDKKLIRKSWRMVDRYDDAEADEAVLLTGVNAFKARFLTRRQVPEEGQTSGAKAEPWAWVDQWPEKQAESVNNSDGATETLPMAIEIEIEIEKWGKLKRVFELAAGGS